MATDTKATKKSAKKSTKKKTAKKQTVGTNRVSGAMDQIDESNGRGRGGIAAVPSGEEGPIVESMGPYCVDVTVEGVSPLLSHAYNVELIEWLGTLPKGDQRKKVDYPTYYCYWSLPFVKALKKDGQGFPLGKPAPKAVICAHTDWLHRALIESGRRYPDPSSTGARRMAKQLVEAGTMVSAPDGVSELTPLLVAPTPGAGTKKGNYRECANWDCLDKRRVTVGTAAVPRSRPKFAAGWRARFCIQVLQPEYITPDFLRKLLNDAGSFQGLGDYRPKFGRFQVVDWELQVD